MILESKMLLIPGPTLLETEVLESMSLPMEAHYGSRWSAYFNNTVGLVQEVLGTESDTFITVGSGHAALDAVIGSLIEDDEIVLILNNGIFGDRLGDIVKCHRGQVVEIKAPWGRSIDVKEVELFLKNHHHRLKAVMVVQNETSTGIVNPIEKLAQLSNHYGVLFFVDAICSIGANTFMMDEWGVDMVATASQKGLGAPPGLAIVAVNEKAFQAIERRKEKPRGWYLNLLIMRDFAQRQKEYQPYSITMAVNNLKALRTSLLKIREEGLANRILRHQRVAEAFRQRVREMGLTILAPEEEACNAVTVIETPQGISSEDLVERLYVDYHIAVANALGDLAGRFIRVGHMGMGANLEVLNPLLRALQEICK